MEFTLDDRLDMIADMVRARFTSIIHRIEHYDSISEKTGAAFPGVVDLIRKDFEKVSDFIDTLNEEEQYAVDEGDIYGDAEYIEDWLANH